MTASVPQPPTDPEKYVRAIARSGLSIYDPIPIGDSDLWIPTQELEALLHHGLIGLSLADLPLRTRSKVVKESVCSVLGYPVPGSFRKTRPRFPGQRFDTYVQKSNNLQVWNEDLSPTRRYVLIRVSGHGRVVRVRVVTGDVLALLDTTGTLTQKYQASYTVDTPSTAELVSPVDTAVLAPLVSKNCDLSRAIPTLHPAASEILPINPGFPAPDGTFIHPRATERTKFCSSHNRPAQSHLSPRLEHQLSGRFSDTAPTCALSSPCGLRCQAARQPPGTARSSACRRTAAGSDALLPAGQ